jgi:hypothetical protein
MDPLCKQSLVLNISSQKEFFFDKLVGSAIFHKFSKGLP